MTRFRWLAVLPAVLAGGIAAGASAEVRPNPLFSDGVVLQRGMPVPVWGTTKNGERVTVAFQGQKVSATPRDGRWIVRLRPLNEGQPSDMTITGENTVVVHNVAVGEVWVCSGQSNMQFALNQSAGGDRAVASSGNRMIRLFTVPRQATDSPLAEAKGEWKECGPDAVRDFTAVGYFFGRELQSALGVPVGLISSNYGGTPAEAWTSREALEAVPAFRELLTEQERAQSNFAQARARYEQQLVEYRAAVEAAKQAGKEPPPAPRAPAEPAKSPQRPTGLYNAMIAPLMPFAIRGAIWYQGESNAGRAHLYQTLFPAMIRNWRQAWGEGEFPFFFVQLAPFMKIANEPAESAWAELREAQRLTTHTVPRTAMAVITDVGEENDIHPKQKEPVGHRLALAALALVYGKRVPYSGPEFQKAHVEGDRILLDFHFADSGLVARDGPLRGFTIAGEDHKWFNAQAEIQGAKVVVHSPDVPHPVAVRYGWANFPTGNLWNKDGLPATPFRTDDFPLTTAKPH